MMRIKIVFGTFMIGACAAALAQQPAIPAPAATTAAAPAPAAPVPAAPAGIGPRIDFATNLYDFGRIKSGDPVKYTYYFTNTGDALLELTDVHPSCGCTAAGDYSKKVDPGQSGQ